jgi:hypothetical protein
VVDRLHAVQAAPLYEPVQRWGSLPCGVTLGGDATSVATDSEDNVYVFNRGSVPMVVFDKNGEYIDGWGEGDFDKPHGIFIDAENDLYLVDSGGHFVQKRSREGKILFTIGTRGERAELQSGRWFNQPTDLVVHPTTRELFISDGYGNSRVHRFSPEGRYIASFGEPGADEGQFSLPHGIDLVDGERLVVADRENFRLQFFTTTGEYLEQWHAHRPCAVRQATADKLVFVAELGVGLQHNVPNIGHRVCIRDAEGRQLATLGAPLPGFEPDQFYAPHALAVDSRGDLYVAEVNYSYITTVQRREAPRLEPVSLRKWRRIVEKR